MKNKLKYKDFIGSVEFSAEDDVFHGEILGINDLIMFEGNSVDELKKDFEETVEDYIQFCKDHGKPLFKSFSGTFNVRVKPDTHSRAAHLAIENGLSLNQFVEEAIENEIKSRSKTTKKRLAKS